MLGEGLLPTLREVFASGTAAKDACVVPRSAYVEAALFEDASLAKRRGPDDYRRQRCKAVWNQTSGAPHAIEGSTSTRSELPQNRKETTHLIVRWKRVASMA